MFYLSHLKCVCGLLLRFFICAIYPIAINAIIVPFTFLLITEMESLYFVSALQVGVGQTVVILSLGLFVYMALLKIQKRRGGRL